MSRPCRNCRARCRRADGHCWLCAEALGLGAPTAATCAVCGRREAWRQDGRCYGCARRPARGSHAPTYSFAGHTGTLAQWGAWIGVSRESIYRAVARAKARAA